MSDSRIWPLFRLLARGGFHSGPELARELGVSRAAVWKLKGALEAMGVGIHSVRGRGYRIDPPLELLDRERLLRHAPGLGGWDLRMYTETDSTHDRLWAGLEQGDIRSGCACLAEYQTAGRGRRGRRWHSPPGRNLYLSLYWRFDQDPSALTGLSLALGLAVARSLESLGLRDIGLKWPNDLQVRGRKLAGLLVELRGQSGGPVDVVAGLGLNYGMEPSTVIDQPWTDLHQCMSGEIPGRNECAGVLLQALAESLSGYEPGRFPEVREAWERFDVLNHRSVSVQGPRDEIRGIARGLAEDGALRVEVDGRVRCFSSGEVRVRTADGPV